MVILNHLQSYGNLGASECALLVTGHGDQVTHTDNYKKLDAQPDRSAKKRQAKGR